MGDMTRLLLLLWAGVSVSSAVDLQKRMTGGKPCKDTERGYHVYVQGDDGTEKSMCGGSLISNQWILTAARCKKSKTYVYLGQHPGQLDLDESKRQEISHYEIYRDKKGDHDLMLLKLPKATNIQPVKLPSGIGKCTFKPKMMQVAGYGATETNDEGAGENDKPNTLQCADMPVDSCKSLLACLKNARDKTMHKKYSYQDLLCYKDSPEDVSPGDSGGGVVQDGMIYGVITFGGGEVACAVGAASISVCKYKTWIEKVLKSN